MISTTRGAAQFVPAGASVLAISGIVTIAPSDVADAALVDLRDIAECDVQEAACPDEDHQQSELFHDQQINGIVGGGLRVKARAAEIAFKVVLEWRTNEPAP